MKSFKQFILEESKYSAEEIAKKIITDCGYFLSESRFDPEQPYYHAIFRGIRNSAPNEIFKKWKVNKKRLPSDMPLDMHEALDDYFYEKFNGVRFRSESVFVTGDTSFANQYGDVFMVFPIGKFKYAWELEINDAWEYFINSDLVDTPQELTAMLKKFDFYTNRKLDEAISSKSEIMIACDEYYTLPLPHNPLYNEIDNKTSEFIDEIFEYLTKS